MARIEISETAARKIRTLMAKQGIDEGGLRVGVKGGGMAQTVTLTPAAVGPRTTRASCRITARWQV